METKFHLPSIEKRMLSFWKKDQTFSKTLDRTKKGKRFVFYEGPPTGNGRPGIHHVLARSFKDVICRYKTMQGFFVERRAGWDAHGLPVELAVEKQLGLESKKDIESYGIAKFCKACRTSFGTYIKEWEKLTSRIGFWIDMKNPYYTSSASYMESVWHILKHAHESGLLYQGYKVVPHCPRCETSLSSHELSLGYKTTKDPSLYVLFPIRNGGKKFENTSLLVWTTTPWTLPANSAIAVHPDIIYCKILSEGKSLIIAKDRLQLFSQEYAVQEEFSGKELLGLSYEPLYSFLAPEARSYEVVAGNFVTTEEGTGLVHIAPAFGQDDMDVAKKENLSIFQIVTEQGTYISQITPYKGMSVRNANGAIITDLAEKGRVWKKETVTHEYPFCWRCGTALIYLAKESWFLAMRRLRSTLLKHNKNIHWIPSHLQEGRFGEWLKDVKDWVIDRNRYWGTPLPFWKCTSCEHVEVVGSIADLIQKQNNSSTIYLMRHGHSHRQLTKKAVCWPEKTKCPLTSLGVMQVKRSARQLRKEHIDVIVASDLLRTTQTAELVAQETGAKLIFDKRLREHDVGIFNGKDPKEAWEYLTKKKNRYTARLPEGESFQDIRKRMYKVMHGVARRYKGKRILLISHELPLTMAEYTAQGMGLEELLEKRHAGDIPRIQTAQWKRISFAHLPFNERMELDMHRPYIDAIQLSCSSCGERATRIPHVLDVWFDSGSMPFAQWHYPFERKKLIDRGLQFPADYICEGIDQTRGWFYTLLAVSTILEKQAPYKNVISVGLVLDEKGEKMSKSKGNIKDPWEVADRHGIDAARWYLYTVNQPGEPKRYSDADIEEVVKKFFLTFFHCIAFVNTYGTSKEIPKSSPACSHVLDKWILSRLEKTKEEVSQNLDRYDITRAARGLESFLTEDVSLWYIRRSRRRFQKPQSRAELKEASRVLRYVLAQTVIMSAPFIPFTSEQFAKDLGMKESIHCAKWPAHEPKKKNDALEKKMDHTRSLVGLALAERSKAKIKVRQPLSLLSVHAPVRLEQEFCDIIQEEVNVKAVDCTIGEQDRVSLETTLSEELLQEGALRECIRHIQELRKKSRFGPQDKIIVYVQSSQKRATEMFQHNASYIQQETLAHRIVHTDSLPSSVAQTASFQLRGDSCTIGIKKK